MVCLPNMTVYKFNTFDMNFIQNEHVKLNETRLDVQGQLNIYLSNTLDILGHLTSKLQETLTTACTCSMNSIKSLKTQRNTHKHIEPHLDI